MNKDKDRLNEALALLDTYRVVADSTARLLFRLYEDADLFAGRLKELNEKLDELKSDWEDEDGDPEETKAYD